MEKIRTGVYGGSFNPIHCGHIALARQLLQKAGLDEVWFVVSPQNPLKQRAQLLDDGLRLQLARRALQPYRGLTATGYEFSLPRPSYMWNTLQAMSRDFPQRELHLVIGADNWLLFSRWYRAADIIGHYPIVVYPRQGCTVSAGSLPATVRLVHTPLYNISSTEIRADVLAGRSIAGKVPACIEDDVRHLYSAAAARR